jgi:hypothetical protein
VFVRNIIMVEVKGVSGEFPFHKGEMRSPIAACYLFKLPEERGVKVGERGNALQL